MNEYYEWLTNIGSLNFRKKSALLIGAGNIAKHHLNALLRLNINDITVISNTSNQDSDFLKNSNIKFFSGGFEKNLPKLEEKDITIIATPIHLLVDVAKFAIKNGQNNILIEKPGSLYSNNLLFEKTEKNLQTVRIAYNRLTYPSLHKLKKLTQDDGGITSCRFTMTEWIDKIDLTNNIDDVYQRWGISNSLHVISMVSNLIGLPKEIDAKQSGYLDWHKSGSIFVGSGISEKSIPFSYHADWKSNGRWGIEVFTEKNSYLLTPLEQLFVCPKNSTNWTPVKLEPAFPDIKAGIAEQIAIMLSDETKIKSELIDLDRGIDLIQTAEKIFGYKSDKKLV